MPDRRQFLTLTGLAAAAVGLAGCGTPDHPTATPPLGAAAAMAGSVTNPTGTVGGHNLSTLQDAYTGHFAGLKCPAGAAQAQWNMAVLLSSQAGACTVGNPYSSNELTLRIVLFGYADLPDCASPYPPVGDLPLTFTVPNVLQTTSEGTHRSVLQAYVMKAKSNGGLGGDTAASSGTVTFTRMDSTQFEGSYDLRYGTSAVTGAFVAPWCGTAP
jgi:TAT (twin-arginine translocation) pathway signal sequence